MNRAVATDTSASILVIFAELSLTIPLANTAHLSKTGLADRGARYAIWLPRKALSGKFIARTMRHEYPIYVPICAIALRYLDSTNVPAFRLSVEVANEPMVEVSVRDDLPKFVM